MPFWCGALFARAQKRTEKPVHWYQNRGKNAEGFKKFCLRAFQGGVKSLNTRKNLAFFSF